MKALTPTIAALTMAAIAASLSFSAIASAQEVEHDAIEEKNLVSGKDKLDPAKAYIYVTGPYRTQGVFVKTPDDADIAEYEAEWNEEFAEAKRKYPNRLNRYNSELAVWKKAPRGKAPEKPEEPTEENFGIGQIESRLLVSFGPQFIYSKDKTGPEDSFSYLMEIEPGEYSYYGPLFMLNGQPPVGTCFCMGSVKFAAPAGQVTSLGDFLHFRWVSDEAAAQTAVNIDPNFKRDPRPVDYSVPARLAEFGAKPADLRAAGKMNNFFGIMIGRIAPIEGVIAYERDTPIDLKGLAEQRARDAAAEAIVEAAMDPASEASDEVSDVAADLEQETAE